MIRGIPLLSGEHKNVYFIISMSDEIEERFTTGCHFDIVSKVFLNIQYLVEEEEKNMKSITSLKVKTLRTSLQSVRSYQFKARYGAFINGSEQISKNETSKYKMYSPASGEYLTEIVNTSEAQTKEAIEIAHATFENGVWSKADVRTRANVLNAMAVELRKEIPRLLELEVAQTGRAIKEMRAQVSTLLSMTLLSMCSQSCVPTAWSPP